MAQFVYSGWHDPGQAFSSLTSPKSIVSKTSASSGAATASDTKGTASAKRKAASEFKASVDPKGKRIATSTEQRQRFDDTRLALDRLVEPVATTTTTSNVTRKDGDKKDKTVVEGTPLTSEQIKK